MEKISEKPEAAVNGKKIFTILHTNDLHSNLIGLGPATDYTPNILNDDQTIGGFARVAAVIAERRQARQAQGPVLMMTQSIIALIAITAVVGTAINILAGGV